MSVDLATEHFHWLLYLLICFGNVEMKFSVIHYNNIESMMEKPQRRVSENNPVLVRRLDTFFVHNTSRRRSKVPNATPLHAMHVVREREERIAGTRHTVELSRVVRALLCAERRRGLLEQAFPLFFLAALEYLASDEEVDRIRFIGALDTSFEWERKNARMVS